MVFPRVHSYEISFLLDMMRIAHLVSLSWWIHGQLIIPVGGTTKKKIKYIYIYIYTYICVSIIEYQGRV